MTKTLLTYIGIFTVVAIGIILLLKTSDLSSSTENNNQAGVISAEVTNEKETMEQQIIEQKITRAIVQTSLGTIEIELFNDKTPKTVENFITLTGNDFYNGTRFHRVIEGFMIQGGDPLSKDTAQIDRWGTGSPGYMFSDEIHSDNSNVAGTIAMANAGPNTNGSQFFINVSDNAYLNDKHTVFGKVVSGYDIVEKISMVDTIPGSDRPLQDILVQSIEIR